MAKQRRKLRWRRIFFLFILLALIVAGLIYVANNWQKVSSISISFDDQPTATKSSEMLGDEINVLLVGQGDKIDGSQMAVHDTRADFIMLAVFNTQYNTVRLINIPRETIVGVPSGNNKSVGWLYANSGIEGLKLLLSDVLSLPLNYYVVADWQGLRDMVDAVGGVDIYVDNDMHYSDADADINIELVRGFQHLDGKQADNYIRYRQDGMGDIGRLQRQNKFLREWERQFFSWRNVVKLPFVYKAARASLATNIDDKTMLKLLYILGHYRDMDLPIYILPGKQVVINKASYWQIERTQLKNWLSLLL